MKLLAVMAALFALAGCSHSRVNVDLDSCQERGKIDGIRVAACEQVRVVK